MKNTYLEVTFRRGKPFAAYLYLPRRAVDRSARTEKREPGMVIDYAADGRPIGIEFTSLSGGLKLGAINQVLDAAHEAPVTPEDLAPLAVA
jgi:hypothetical protein